MPLDDVPLSRRRRSRGFTLIELLVVIAIIAILAAIIFPAFNRARDSARRSNCVSNLKQIGMAVQQYTQDYDERLPNSSDGGWGTDTAPNVSWNYFTDAGGSTNTFDMSKGSLFTYLKNVQIFVCPSDSAGQNARNSYAANSCLFSDATTLVPPHTAFLRSGRHLAAFPEASATLLFCEEGMSIDNQASTDDAYFNRAYPNIFSSRHAGGSVIAYLDGHTKWLSVDRLNQDFPVTPTEGDCTN